MGAQPTSDTVNGLRRVRSQLCRLYRKEDEVPDCQCVYGAHDAGRGRGMETGCKEIYDAIQKLQDDEQ